MLNLFNDEVLTDGFELIYSYKRLVFYWCSGRAGREGPGKCYRLYLESKFWEFDESATPEIKRCNLSNVVLQLKALGVEDIVEFDFIEKPSR